MLLVLALQVSNGIAFPAKLINPPEPAVVQARIMPAVPCKVQPWHPEPDPFIQNKDGSTTWILHGKRIRIHNPGRFSSYEVGRDGSILVTYADGAPMVSLPAIIKNSPQKEWLIKYAHDPSARYQDPKNYFYDQADDDMPIPSGPYKLHRVRNGVDESIGWGGMDTCWWPDEALTEVMVDANGTPCGMEQLESRFLRYYDHDASFDIGPYQYLDRLADHILVLSKGTTIYRWRHGKFLSAVRMPDHWMPICMNRRGDIFARYFDGLYPEEDVLDRRNEDWKAAILRGHKFYPLSLRQPNGTKALIWRSTRSEDKFDENDRYTLAAFWGDPVDYFRLSPDLKQIK